MARSNAHYKKLAAGYLFPEIARRAKAFVAEHPGVELFRLGIGDTTVPLSRPFSGACARESTGWGASTPTPAMAITRGSLGCAKGSPHSTPTAG